MFTRRYKPQKDLALTASHQAFIDSSATAHVMKGVSIITGKVVSSNISTSAAGKHMFKATDQRESVKKLSRGEKPVALNRSIHVASVETSLVPASNFCDDDHTMESTNSECVVKKNICMSGAGKQM